MVKYSTESMTKAADKITDLINGIKEELDKLDGIANNVELAIKGGNAGTTFKEKIIANKKELNNIVVNLEQIVPLIKDTRDLLVENDNKLTDLIGKL